MQCVTDLLCALLSDALSPVSPSTYAIPSVAADLAAMSGQVMRHCWHAYESSLQRHPIRTEALMTATLWCEDIHLVCLQSCRGQLMDAFCYSGQQGTFLLKDRTASAGKESINTTIVGQLSLLLMEVV